MVTVILLVVHLSSAMDMDVLQLVHQVSPQSMVFAQNKDLEVAQQASTSMQYKEHARLVRRLVPHALV
jgi:hypothetical protein